MGEGRGHEGEQNAPANVPVSPEVFNEERSQLHHAQASDHGGDRQVGSAGDGQMQYARQVSAETAAEFLYRTGDTNPKEFKVMCGVLDLAVRTGAYDSAQLADVQQRLMERSSQQSNPLAAAGLAAMANKIGQYGNA
ncbi:MAG: hypothetical protein JSS86_15895 [Cyanobacteria bacterium SZAS LIN-2]|nr:hypothetical protein [Cyanobacteria bacterium SZAS LIN-3]MBS1997806.1 hypothetical protein [Cyanobacteria bacterium SZAS LIN-2]